MQVPTTSIAGIARRVGRIEEYATWLNVNRVCPYHLRHGQTRSQKVQVAGAPVTSHGRRWNQARSRAHISGSVDHMHLGVAVANDVVGDGVIGAAHFPYGWWVIC